MKNNKLAQKCFIERCIQEYCTGIFSDELDKLGYKKQVSSDWRLNNQSLRIFGKARTIEIEEIETKDERISIGLNFLANLQQDEVLLVKGSYSFAYFGELMTRLSREIGINGAIIDGLTRDTYYTQTTNFPVFAKGYTPVDIKGRGRVKAIDIPIKVDGIEVCSGDIIFADSDAVVFVPKNIFSELLPYINKAAEEEYEIKEKIKAGTSIKEILLKHKEF